MLVCFHDEGASGEGVGRFPGRILFSEMELSERTPYIRSVVCYFVRLRVYLCLSTFRYSSVSWVDGCVRRRAHWADLHEMLPKQKQANKPLSFAVLVSFSTG